MDWKSFSDKVDNGVIVDSIHKAEIVLNRKGYKNIWVTISGGADSDIVIDICTKLDKRNHFHYIFFNTGIEYKATLNHLDFLEDKYGITILRDKALLPVPAGCNKYGQPFVSKLVSDYLSRLQRHGFKWEDRPFDELIKEYPKCITALKWWCNEGGEGSRFNINRNKYLKEFMIANPPTFSISDKCCNGAKKKNIQNIIRKYDVDLVVTGVRKAEGGLRSSAYHSCFDDSSHYGCAQYRPIFWYKKQDKEDYERLFNITHSDCYTKYGLLRTGCCGCPLGRDFENELEAVKENEPKLYNAACSVFKDSYKYTREYMEYRKRRENFGEN